jgi:hypothetical protein
LFKELARAARVWSLSLAFDSRVCIAHSFWVAALQIDAAYIKALVRRATAHERLERYEKAMDGKGLG